MAGGVKYRVAPSNPKRRVGIIVAIVLAVVVIVAATLIANSCNRPKDTGEAPKSAVTQKRLVRPTAGPLSASEFSLVNGEELYVRLLDNDLPQAYEAGAGDFSMVVKVTPVSGDGVWKKTYTGEQLKADGSWSSAGNEVGIVLDSLREGLSMTEQKDDDGKTIAEVIGAGNDMSVYVAAYYGNYGTDNAEGDIENWDGQTVNSLFASVSDQDGRKTASIVSLRQLANLSSDKAADGSYQSVSIDADISTSGGGWNDAATVSPSARVDGAATCPVDSIKPIALVASANDADGKVAGNDHTISGLSIGDESATTENAGLFSTVSCEVCDLTLANVKVFGASNTGALAGTIEDGANVHNCNVVVQPVDDAGYDYRSYAVIGSESVGGLAGAAAVARIDSCVATVDVTGSSMVGGLVGKASGTTITNCATRAAAILPNEDTTPPVVAGTTSVGGLVGIASGAAAIEKCLAAVDVISVQDDVSGSSRFGGLVGALEGTTIARNCYATGLVRASSMVGGLVGRVEGAKIISCFCTGDVNGDSATGGFAGSLAGKGEIAGSISYSAVLNVSGNESAQLGGFFGALDDNDFVVGETNGYLCEAGFNAVPAADAKKADGVAYGHAYNARELAAEDGGIRDAAKLHPYSIGKLGGVAFGFKEPTGIGEIWGNWPRSYMARWFYDNGELICERRLLSSSSMTFPGSIRYAERPAAFDATSPYYLFAGWDESTDADGNYNARARAVEIPVNELVEAEPTAAWAKALRDEIAKHVDGNFYSTEDFEIDSMLPNAPSNPDTFSYQVVGLKGERPVVTMGQKLPAYGSELGQFRALRFTLNESNMQVGYVNIMSVEQGGARYYVYGSVLTADNLDLKP